MDVITCACCTRDVAPGKSTRRLCPTCESRHRYAGTLHLYPRVLRPSADTAEDAEILRRRDPSLTLAEVAAQLGMTRAAVDRALVRHRARERAS